MLSRQEILAQISDLSKEAYGFRMRKDWAALSDAELQAEWDYLFGVAVEAAQREAEVSRHREAAWLARIQELQQDHGVSQSTAIRWDMQAYDLKSQDVAEYCYTQGISFAWEEKVLQILRANS